MIYRRCSCRDAARKPAELLAFAQVKPGPKVGDYVMGGGYVTRLLAAAVVLRAGATFDEGLHRLLEPLDQFVGAVHLGLHRPVIDPHGHAELERHGPQRHVPLPRGHRPDPRPLLQRQRVRVRE